MRICKEEGTKKNFCYGMFAYKKVIIAGNFVGENPSWFIKHN